MSRLDVDSVCQCRGIDAVLIDLDGTLIDTERECRLAFFDALLELGCNVAQLRYNLLVGRSTPDRLKLLQSWFPGRFPADTFVTVYRHRRDERFSQGITLKPGALELLLTLRKLGIPFAIVTAASRAGASARMVLSNIEAPTVITRDDVLVTKPHPACMLLAAERLGVNHSRCLVVEDSEPGLRAGLSAGMHVVLVPDVDRATGWNGPRMADLHGVVEMITASQRALGRGMW